MKKEWEIIRQLEVRLRNSQTIADTLEILARREVLIQILLAQLDKKYGRREGEDSNTK